MDVALLIYNQKKILKHMEMIPEPVNFMDNYLKERIEEDEEEDRETS